MATAQNGWPVIPNTDAGRRRLADLVLPGAMPHPVRVLDGDVATIARWHVREYHRRVEPIEPAGCWGWNVRKIGDGPDWSNHAAACAWDLNAPDNPDGTPTSKVMTPAQIHECHKLERASGGVLRWGGDWSDPDAMHWEIVGTPGQAAVFAEKIRNEEDTMTQEQFVELMRHAVKDPEIRRELARAIVATDNVVNLQATGGKPDSGLQSLIRWPGGGYAQDTRDKVAALEAKLDEILTRLPA
jgi:hypothetical protein